MQKTIFLFLINLAFNSYSGNDNTTLNALVGNYAIETTDILDPIPDIVDEILQNNSDLEYQLAVVYAMDLIVPDPTTNIFSKTLIMQHIFQRTIENKATDERDLPLMKALAHVTPDIAVNRAFKYCAELNNDRRQNSHSGIYFLFKTNRAILKLIASRIDEGHKTQFNLVQSLYNDYTRACKNFDE